MAVNTNISDLFFNTDHTYVEDAAPGDEFYHLEEEARDFLNSLEALGLQVPTVADLIKDFHNRL
jgi:hypothetical protein